MEVEITIPSETKDITLEQYQLLMKTYNKGDSEDLAARKMISIFCKIPMSQVMYISYSSVSDLLQKFQFMFKAKNDLQTTFTLGGVEFGFIPNLEKMSFGEYIDLENYISDWQTMNNAMAVMYRPITEKNKKGEYLIEPYESSITYAEVMKAAPLHVVLGAQVFFWSLGVDLLNGLLIYLEKELKTIPQEVLADKLNLTSGGGGISQYMQLLKENLNSLTKLPDYHLLSV